MSIARGKFIVIEGTDGSGTTTQCELIVAALEQRGLKACRTREPTDGPIGRLLRQALEHRLEREPGVATELDWSTLALLFAADRTDHVVSEIMPTLDNGTWVISDRYDLSSLIYQSLTAPDADVALRWVRELNTQALRPDLVVVLDVDADVAELRRQQRGGKQELFERRELQLKLVNAYRTAEQFALRDRISHVDGDGSIGEVARRVLAAIESDVGIPGSPGPDRSDLARSA